MAAREDLRGALRDNRNAGGVILIYGLDTETDNDGGRAWIVQWSIHNGKKSIHGRTADELEEALIRLGGRYSGTHYIYIHNLRYDLAFLRYIIYNISLRYDGEILPVIRKGSPVSVRLRFKGKTLIFRDSSKKWQGNLRSLGRAYGLEKLDPPGDEDFSPGWSERIDWSSPDVWRYVDRDAEICRVAMAAQHKQGFKASTTSGDAWHDMHRVINGSHVGRGPTKWDNLFPRLDHELYAELCKAYSGGINISMHRGECLSGPITHEDRVSMYPSIMAGTEGEKLPYGLPIYIGGELPPDGELYITRQRLRLRLRDNRIPWYMFKSGADYLYEGLSFGTPIVETQEWHILTLTSVDLDNLALDYEVELDPSYDCETWVFRSEVGILKPYVDKWIAAKTAAAKGSPEREHAKRMLNAAYGRFALSQESERYCLLEEDGDLQWRSWVSVEPNDGYLPYAAFVTAWARRRLMDRVRMVCDIYGADAIIHSDTDSVIYRGAPIGMHGNALGDWSIESQPSRIWEGGFKRYIEEINGGLSMACAGVPQRRHPDGVPYGMWVELLDDPDRILGAHILGHEDYRINSDWLRQLYIDSGRDPDHVNTLKLLPRSVPGGVILEGHQHTLSDNMSWRFSRAF